MLPVKIREVHNIPTLSEPHWVRHSRRTQNGNSKPPKLTGNAESMLSVLTLEHFLLPCSFQEIITKSLTISSVVLRSLFSWSGFCCFGVLGY